VLTYLLDAASAPAAPTTTAGDAIVNDWYAIRGV
jgi:hypothetical protein